MTSQCFMHYRRALTERGIFQLPVNLKRARLSGSDARADVDRTLEAAEAKLRAAYAR